MNAKTTTKAASVKTTKAAGNTPVKAKEAKPLSLVAYIVAGIEARKDTSYYKSAIRNHKKEGTVFPRERNNAARLALTKEEADYIFDLHAKRVLTSGNKQGQAMFDCYMMQASKASK